MMTDILGRSSLGLEREVTELLLKIGVPAHIKGFRILRRAILITIDDSQAIESITNILYPDLADEFNSTPANIERAMRYAIESAWQRGDMSVISSYFGWKKPANAEFIATIADKVRLQIDIEQSK